jgi:3-phosphoshikimate 1-carboxyvinyltransferase
VQGDIQVLPTCWKKWAHVFTWGDDYIECSRGELRGIDMDMNHIPDAAMTIATAALFARRPDHASAIFTTGE